MLAMSGHEISRRPAAGLWVASADISMVVVWMQCHVRNKDIRKFLDGCYVSEKGNVVKNHGHEDEKTKK